MYKGIIAPIVAVIFIAIQGIFGIEVDEVTKSSVVDVIANIIAVALVLIGVFKNYDKPKEGDVGKA